MIRTELEMAPEVLTGAKTQKGESLDELSRRAPVLVVFLRHSGCPFCRQALADVSEKRQAISAAGAQIALVHLQSDVEAAKLFARYGLDDVPRISDPGQALYRAFQLPRGSLAQVTGPGVWREGLKSLLSGNLPGIPSADVRQMPGVFLVHDGRVLRSFRHAMSGDRPDYVDLATCPSGEQGA
ncbi:MAG: SelL-related redox protein [Deltaproteobacteria bacterium]